MNRRFILSVLLGFAGFAGTFYSTSFDFPPHTVTIIWTLFLPMLAALSYGWRAGLIVSTIGLAALFPFWLWPSNGWANLVNVIQYTCWFAWHGYCAARRNTGKAPWNHIYVAQLLFTLFYVAMQLGPFRWLFTLNPPFWYPAAATTMPSHVLAGITVKAVVVLFLHVCLCDTLLTLPAVRRLFGLPVTPAARSNMRIIASSAMIGLIAAVLFIALDVFLLEGNITIIADSIGSPHHLGMAILIVFLSVAAGAQSAHFFEARTAAEDTLRESEALFRSQFEFGHIGSALTSVEKGWLRVNPRLCEMLGYTEVDLRQKTWAEMTHPDDLTPDVTQFNRMLAGEIDAYEMDKRFYRKDASVIFTHMTVSCFRNPDRSVRFVIASLQDITEHKKAEQLVRQNARRLSLAISATADAVWEWNLLTGETYYSPRWYEMLGYPDQQFPMTFDAWKQLCHPDDLQPTVDRIHDVLNSPASSGYEAEFRMRTREGSWAWILGRGNVVERNAAGKPVVLSGTNTDITARKRAAEALLESESMFRAYFDAAPYPVVLSDLEGRYRLVNKAFESISGVPASEVLGKTPLEIGLVQEYVDPGAVDELLEKGRIDDRLASVCLRDGNRRHVLFSSRALNLGGIKQILTVTVDITALKHAEEALMISEERFRNLSSIASEGIMIHESGIIVDANQAFANLLGYANPDDLIGKHGMEMIRLTEPSRTLVIDHMRTGATDSYEIEFARLDGTLVPVETSGRDIVYQGRKTRLVYMRDITERKRAEEALRQHQQTISAIVETSHDWIWVVDLTGRHTYSNPAVQTILGYSPEEFQEIGIELLHPDDRHMLETQLAGWIEMRQGWSNLVVRWRHRDGTYRYLESTSVPILGSQGEMLGFRGVDRDITERAEAEQELRKSHEELNAAHQQLVTYDREIRQSYEELTKSQEALRQSEEKYRMLAENASDIIWSVDMNLKFTYISPSAERIHGWTMDEWNSLRLHEILTPESLDVAMKTLAEELSVEDLPGIDPFRTRTLELEEYCKDGSTIWLEVTASLIRDQHGKIEKIMGVSRDITERKRAKEALIDSEARLRAIIDSAPDAIFIQDLKNRYLQVNKAFPRLFNLPEDKILGRTFDEMFDEASTARVREENEKILAGEIIEVEVERVVNGYPRIFNMIKAPLRNHLGEIIGICGIGRDITDRRNLETQLFQSQKMEAIGTLAGGIAHDFNNILTAIIGFSELSIEEISGDHPLRENLRQILNAGLRARSLVSQILTFSRQSEVEIGPVMPAPLVKEAVKMLRASLPSTIRVKHQIQSPMDTIKADATQLYQVIMNLATNAADAMMETAGTLEIRVERVDVTQETPALSVHLSPGNYVRLAVKDTGIGMDRATKDRIFEPFFTTKPKGKGTGLGLSVVYGIVKSHKGTIIVDSEPGKGTTFDVYFPRVKEKESLKKERPRDIPGGTEHILFVDDEAGVADAAQKLLERLGYKVTMRTSSVDALEAFRAQPARYDLVISDVTMPNMTGTELTRQILNIRPGMPIILCTGFSELIDEEKLWILGIRAFIMKPVTYRDLAATVRQVLDAG